MNLIKIIARTHSTLLKSQLRIKRLTNLHSDIIIESVASASAIGPLLYHQICHLLAPCMIAEQGLHNSCFFLWIVVQFHSHLDWNF